jgi:hypothetical protein
MWVDTHLGNSANAQVSSNSMRLVSEPGTGLNLGPMKQTTKPRRDSFRWRRALGSVALTLTVLVGLGGCSDEEDGCLWDADDLLERVRAGVTNDRVFCGMVFDGGDPAQADALDCFLAGPSDTELFVNHCIDCFAISTYYRNSRSEIFGIHQTAEYTQEPPRRSIVTRCATLVIEQGYIRCSPPEEELYYCAEPESAWEMPEPPVYPPGRAPPGSAPSGQVSTRRAQ